MPRNRETCVPNSAIRRIVDRELAERETTLTDLEVTLGRAEGYLRQLLSREWIGFNAADRLLTRLHLSYLWHVDEELIEACDFLDQVAENDRLLEQEKADRKSVRKQREELKRQGFCPKGHPMSEFWTERPPKEENNWDNKSYCRECKRIQRQEWNKRHPERAAAHNRRNSAKQKRLRRERQAA